jgi:hypothetical protein
MCETYFTPISVRQVFQDFVAVISDLYVHCGLQIDARHLFICSSLRTSYISPANVVHSSENWLAYKLVLVLFIELGM